MSGTIQEYLLDLQAAMGSSPPIIFARLIVTRGLSEAAKILESNCWITL
jgi:hypothetical protein